MKNFTVPTREEVSPANQTLFDNLTKMAGHVPNLFAVFAHSETALSNYLTLSSGKTSLRPKEKEVINLIVSQVNGCQYCLSAHTAISKMQGFTDEQILEIRRASISFDSKLDALVKLTKSIAENKGHADGDVRQRRLLVGKKPDPDKRAISGFTFDVHAGFHKLTKFFDNK